VVELQPIRFKRLTLDWGRTYVLGVVNVTPDSFSDGGRFFERNHAIVCGRALVAAGADFVDVGGESTRPGATPVSTADERERVVPVVGALAVEATVSIDTYKASTADAALQAGAEIVNDVSGGVRDPEILKVAAHWGAAVILGHTRGTPEEMQSRASYDDLVREVRDELAERAARAVEAGVQRGRILLDPGLGFAKSAQHNFTLLRRLHELQSLGFPLVVGASRKSFLGLTGKPPGERQSETNAANVAAVLGGAQVLRMHEIELDPIRVADAVRRAP
jgi:dihydropteroate synthase